MEETMKADLHETIRRIIDRTLVDGLSLQEEQSLREHLRVCAECQAYFSNGARVIASLSEFSFAVDPGLQAKVCAALKLRAQQLESRQFSRRLVWSCVIALLLTAAGSFIDLQFGKRAAAFFHLQSTQVQRGLLAFWIMPSLPLLLLFPILSMLSTSSTNQKGSIL
jgi:hypothetical protein